MTPPAFMWVARARWALVWMVVKLSGEGTQYCIVGGWYVMSQAAASEMIVPVWQRWNIDLLWPRWLHCPQNKWVFSLRCKLTAESWPEELALLCCAIHLWKGCFVSHHSYLGPISDLCLRLACDLHMWDLLPPLPAWASKTCTDQLADVITDNFKISLSHEAVPSYLKAAIIFPVPRKVCCFSS